MSNHIINGGDRLGVHISLLFTAMFRHGYSPEGMVNDTMVPHLKGKWLNAKVSDNYRAITLSSILGKLMDTIIMDKESQHLLTSKLQFGFKRGVSTSLCTCLVQETVSYYVSNNTNVYGLLLDASKAFDRVNIIKLFKVMLSKKVCPMICRLLLNMYVTQKLRVQWDGILSDSFGVTNGVKQGGVISPILFCIYLDGLLVKLEENGMGCYMGGMFSGAYAYADDLTLLAPSVGALKSMIQICIQFARDYDIQFNGKKSQLIVFKANRQTVPDPCIIINGETVSVVKSVVHLGHLLNENIFKVDTSKCIGDFNKQCNMFLADFRYASSYMRNILFKKLCNNFYGSQILPLYDDSFENLYKAWRIAVRRVWRIPWRAHSSLLPHLAGVMSPKLWFAKRALSFAKVGLQHRNENVKYILRMGSRGSYSIFGGNVRYLEYKYDLSAKEINEVWRNTEDDNENEVRLAYQIAELCRMRDSGVGGILSREECSLLLNDLCLS